MMQGTVQLSVFSWNTRLARCSKAGQYEETIDLFQQMQEQGIKPDRFTFVPVLNACGSLRALKEGRCIHAQITRSGYESDVAVGRSLVDMYVKCGIIEDACRVFNKWLLHEVVAWSIMIQGYVKCGQGEKALELFQQMKQEGVEPAAGTFVAVLKACTSVTALEEGRRVHEQIMKRGVDADVVVGTSLVGMYARCGSIEDAQRVFNKMPIRNVVSWNIIILGYVKCGQAQQALKLFQQMQQEGVKPVTFTFVAALNACASVAALEEGKHIHEQIIEMGCECDVFVGSSLIDMYAKCGNIDAAKGVFKKLPRQDVVSWSALIQGHVKCGQGLKALELYEQMQQEGVEPDHVTLVGVLNACASVGAIEEGKKVHEQVMKRGCESNVYVGSSLVDMYAKCGSIDNARKVFNKMSSRSVVSWNAMVMGHLTCGQGEEALELHRQMRKEGVELDPATFVGVLGACAVVEALDEGRCVHEHIIQQGYESDVSVCNSLVDMYAKCGSLEDACNVFYKMPMRNVVSWNVMLGGYAIHGKAKEALGHFEWMCQEEAEMNMVTFVSLLSACNHGGLVDEGLQCFQSMTSVYNVGATVEHYACIVDLLGRSGRLHEAVDFIKMMSCKPDAAVSMSLLGACRVHGNVQMGKSIAEQVLELEPSNSAGYVLLSNIYATAGKWDISEQVNQQRLGRGVNKEPGHS